MKKELLIASVFAATIAGAGSVTTSNTMGYIPVTAANSTAVDSKKMYMVVAPFVGYDSDKIALADVIQTAGLTENDEIFIPNGTGYDNYKLNDKGAWSASKVVTINSDGTVTEKSGTPAETAEIVRGKAFWVKTAATSISLFGNAVPDVAEVSAAGGESKNAWTMIGSTLNAPIALSSLDGSSGDTIILANGTRYVKGGTSRWKNFTTGKPVALGTEESIPAGVGFWYGTKSGFKRSL